jgi:hypothetical protein
MKFRHVFYAVLISSTTSVVACAPTLHVKTDFDHATDFSSFHTFRLESGRFVIDEMNVDGSLAKDRIDKALRKQMAVEGLAPAANPGDADLVVKYVAGVRSVEVQQTYGYPIGVYAVPTPLDTWVQEFPQGVLVIDLVEAQTNKLVWRAYCRADGDNFSNQAFIDKSIAKAFEKFPPRTS